MKRKLIASIHSIYPPPKIDRVFRNVDRVIEQGDTFDVIRVDFDIDQNVLRDLVEHQLDSDGLLFMDDTKMNCGFYRIALVFDLILSGKIYPVWLGEKECVFSPTPRYTLRLSSGIHQVVSAHDGVYAHKEIMTVSGQEYIYTVTTDFEIPMVHN
jgi:hypothetical protein